ncbi:uncharacterized protein PG986_000053 [Apiospora aurea]|uniref:Uncharacterized protein n=1 Tax=Apiospora aurea TaxID=335848 RepID=A0ABR1QTV5_9PEZI
MGELVINTHHFQDVHFTAAYKALVSAVGILSPLALERKPATCSARRTRANVHHTASFVDNGLYAYFELMPTHRLHEQPTVGVGKTVSEFSTFYDLDMDLFGDEPVRTSALLGGWLFTYEDVADHNGEIIEAFQSVFPPREDLAGHGYLIGHVWNAAAGDGRDGGGSGSSATNHCATSRQNSTHTRIDNIFKYIELKSKQAAVRQESDQTVDQQYREQPNPILQTRRPRIEPGHL